MPLIRIALPVVSWSLVQYAPVSAATSLYGIHFETASERRWRLRPPVEERAKLRAQRVVGNLVDDIASREHEAKFGTRMSKCVANVYAKVRACMRVCVTKCVPVADFACGVKGWVVRANRCRQRRAAP